MFYLAVFLAAAASASLLVSGHFFGFRRTVIGLVVAAASSSALLFILAHISGREWGMAAMALVCGAIAGGMIIYFRPHGTRHPRIRGAWQAFWRDKRKLVVTAACAAAVILTIIFAQQITDKQSFWYGFYQSWTAGFVAFMLFGLATTIASLAKPEDDDFERRVRILFGGRTGKHIDYIVDAVGKIGYYSEKVERVYRIESIDFDKQRYQISVHYKSVIRHYIHDVDSTDTLDFSYIPDHIADMEPAGQLISVTATCEDGKPRKLVGGDGLPIPQTSGIEEKWEISIPKGKAVTVDLQYRVWCKFGETETFHPTRFVKSIETEVVRSCTGADVILDCTIGATRTEYKLAVGETVHFPIAHDCSPEVPAYVFKLEQAARG